MRETFSAEARLALREAEKIAKQMNSGFVGSQHILFGLLAIHKGVAEKVLQKNGVTVSKFRNMLEHVENLVIEAEGIAGEDGITEKVLGDPSADYDAKEIIDQLLEAGADCIDLPCPGSRSRPA